MKTRPPKPSAMSVADRITEYLSGGGLFNPEYANHDAVRDLLIDCRNELGAVEARTVEQYKPIGYAQELADGRLCLMETTVPVDELHDNGRPIHQLLIRALPRASERRKGEA